MTLDEVVSSLEADPERGLTAADAAARLASGRNELPRPPRASWPVRIWKQVREPMSLLLVAAAAVSAGLLREPGDALAITAIVIINIVIAVVQEGRAVSA
ncbi:MAG TPA: cation-transporting P-type ATPase, partial [Acidimicrobiia bacterium]